MTDLDAMLRAVVENPEDDTARLVYADAVQESGDEELAALVRVGVPCYCANLVGNVPGVEPSCMSCDGRRWVRGCQHEGCRLAGSRCFAGDEYGDEPPDSAAEWFCGEHAPDHGYCAGCGEFWGGIEEFDFNRAGMCPNCRDSGDWEDDEDDWEDDF